MSTYIPGVQDYIPQVQPFTPDYNFYANVLEFKQGKQDAARKQLSSLYGSLLNAPLTRDDNVASRDKFFKIIEQDIQKMSGMDLSLAQNVDAAKGIFNQLLDNEPIVKDMVWTKNYQAQQQRAQSFKNCTDPEKCGGSWWEGGERLLQYNREEFRNASAEDAMNMGNANYVPHQDLTKKAMALAKEADLNVTEDKINGGWITTTKNGTLVQGALEHLLMGSLGNDPAIMDFYRAQGELQRKDFMYQNASTYGSKEIAEQEYINKMVPLLHGEIPKQVDALQQKLDETGSKKKKLQKAIDSSLPAERSELERLMGDYDQIENGYGASKKVMDIAQGQMDVAERYGQYTGSQVDDIFATSLLTNGVKNSAKLLSLRDASITKEANPYSMEAVKQKNRMMLEEFKFVNKKKLAEYEMTLEQYASVVDGTGPGESNVPRSRKGIPGGIVAGGDLDSDAVKERSFNMFTKDRNTVSSKISSNQIIMLDRIVTAGSAAADQNDVQAQEDIVNLVTQMITGTTEGRRLVGDTPTDLDEVTDEDRLIRDTKLREVAQFKAEIAKAKTSKGKYEVAKKYMKDWGDLEGTHIDNIYDQTVEGILKDYNAGNKVMRDYLNPVWTSSAKEIRNIKATDLYLTNMDKFYNKSAQNVIKDVRVDDPELADAFASYFDVDGNAVNQHKFRQNMEALGYSDERAQELYYGDDKYDTEGDELISRWKRSFTKHAKHDGQSAWAQITGAGNEFAVGQQYDRVDPAEHRSIGLQGTVGMLNDSFDAESAVFSWGDFQETVPSSTDEKAKNVAFSLFNDLKTYVKGDSRPMPTITYSDIAGGDPNKVAMHVVLNEPYAKKFRGSKAKPGDTYDNKAFTVYMDKAEANNIFTQGYANDAVDVMMRWSGEVGFDSHPEYVKDFKAEQTADGTYRVSGSIRTDINQDGKAEWNVHEQYYDAGTSIQGLVKTYDNWLDNIARKNKSLDNNWKTTNK